MQDKFFTLDKAAERLSAELDEPFDEAEILNLALHGRLKLSIFFQSHALAECSIVRDRPSRYARKSIKLDNELGIGGVKYRLFEDHPRHISGLWDLPLLGAGMDVTIEGGRAWVEQRYRELVGQPVPPRSGACGAYVSRPDGTRCELVKKYDPNKFPDESKPFPQPIEYLPTDEFPDDAVLVVKDDALNKYLHDREHAKLTCKVKYSEYSRQSLWMVYQGMFLLLGQRPVIGYHGATPRFGWITERRVERHRKGEGNLKQFSDFPRLGSDIEDDVALGTFPVIPTDKDKESREHDWCVSRLFADDWWLATQGHNGGEQWKPIPRERIGVDICLKRCRPADFLKWAESRGYEIPEELKPLLDEGGQTNNENKTETPDERKERLRAWCQEEEKERGERGALVRTARREGITRQTLQGILNRKK